MSAPIIITAAERDPLRNRRGITLGVASFVLSVTTGFWAIILWAVSIGATESGSGRGVAIVFFALCAIIGFVFLTLTAVTAVFSFRRNVRLGRIWAVVASAIGALSLAAGIVLAVAVATA